MSKVERLQGRRIHVAGVVQGVGFRPFVYGLAENYGLRGWVRNTSAGVDIEVDGHPVALDAFVAALEGQAPPLARIDEIRVEEKAGNGYTAFEIVHSEPIPGAFQPISGDVCVCEDCLREMYDPGDRRYRYPFINCTNCGPRFTIIKDIPYDRTFTTMATFPMCPLCEAEYHDPRDRRFHAQPVACPLCGPGIWLEAGGRKRADGEEALRLLREMLIDGKIAAIKGLGGFHLACDANNPSAVEELRRRKLRIDKPFALLMPDIETVKRHCRLSVEQQQTLQSRSRPIVILETLPTSAISEAVAPHQSSLGVMLPYSPLHFLLVEPADGFPEALVMTSGNLCEEPIAFDNEQARRQLSPLADFFLMHARDIHTRCDDSVVRVLPGDGRRPGGSIYPMRRSRGYAPSPVVLPFDVPEILAAGAELKNTFCLTKDGYAFVSHHIGDLENYETLQAYERSINHYENLFRVTPEAIAHDLHPDYMATRYAEKRAKSDGITTVGVQHHHAHIAAGMADNGLSGERPVIGVSFDGAGYGDDGAIWGGEFLAADYTGYERLAHLAYIPLAGGERAVRNPWRLALTWLSHAGVSWQDDLPPVHFSPLKEREILQRQLLTGINSPPTSSMGRLFDAAASLCGVRHTVNYEAQAAVEFEALVDPSEEKAYPFINGDREIDPAPLIHALVEDFRREVPLSSIAARFHNGVAEMVLAVCLQLRESRRLNQVLLSGGVWQNMALLKRACELLSASGFEVFLHNQVPANDGGVSLGQAVIAARMIEKGNPASGLQEGNGPCA